MNQEDGFHFKYGMALRTFPTEFSCIIPERLQIIPFVLFVRFVVKNYSSIARAFDKADATNPAGTDTIPKPISKMTSVKILPPTVTGAMSP